MAERPGSAPVGADNTFVLTAVNTSSVSLRKLAKRIDELPLGARVVMTVTKREDGVLFWTVQALNGVEQ